MYSVPYNEYYNLLEGEQADNHRFKRAKEKINMEDSYKKAYDRMNRKPNPNHDNVDANGNISLSKVKKDNNERNMITAATGALKYYDKYGISNRKDIGRASAAADAYSRHDRRHGNDKSIENDVKYLNKNRSRIENIEKTIGNNSQLFESVEFI